MKLATLSVMKEYAAGIQSSELRLVEAAPAKTREPGAASAPALSVVPANHGTPRPLSGSADARIEIAPYNPAAPSSNPPPPPSAKVAAPSNIPAVDKFLAAATKEFEANIVDQPLWKHAITQSGNDRTVAIRTYLRARATALRVAKREKRQERQARRARALNELAPPADAEVSAERAEAPSAPAATRQRLGMPKRSRVIGIGGALAMLFAITLFVVVRSQGDAAQQSQSAVKSTAAGIAPKSVRAAAATAANADGATGGEAAREDWAGKLEKLKTEGNWNVVVLHAGEWARSEPGNASAWKELAAGYATLRQYRDALDAANKVVQLVPEDASAWRSLGRINAALRQPADALAAFEQAAARDDHDASSIVQVGALSAQLGRFADARAAFAKALALDPADIDALCGATSLAQKEQRTKDAEALIRQITARDARCRDAEGESVRVAAGDKSRLGAAAR